MRRSIYCIVALFILNLTNLYGQLSIGTDIKSRYNWRGMDFGASPCFQPSMTYTYDILSVGVWGSYSFQGGGFSENDFWASVDIPLSAGKVTVILTDYTFPSSGIRLGNIDDGTGAHTLEIGAGYTGPENVPISVRGYVNVYNDNDKSAYVECSYPLTLGGASITATLGATLYESAAYGTNGFSIINISLTSSKCVEITEKYSLPVSVGFILNPAWEQASIVFGVSL